MKYKFRRISALFLVAAGVLAVVAPNYNGVWVLSVIALVVGSGYAAVSAFSPAEPEA